MFSNSLEDAKTGEKIGAGKIGKQLATEVEGKKGCNERAAVIRAAGLPVTSFGPWCTSTICTSSTMRQLDEAKKQTH